MVIKPILTRLSEFTSRADLLQSNPGSGNLIVPKSIADALGHRG